MSNLNSALIELGEKRGEARGEQIGKLKKAKEVAVNLKMTGMSEEMIAKVVNVSKAVVRQWLSDTAER